MKIKYIRNDLPIVSTATDAYIDEDNFLSISVIDCVDRDLALSYLKFGIKAGITAESVIDALFVEDKVDLSDKLIFIREDY